MQIESYALRRKLSQALQTIYKDRNMIFTQFQRRLPTFTVRKWREKESYEEIKAKEAAGIEKNKEIKVKEGECVLSHFDKIISGKRDGETVYFEDDRCIAIRDRNPVAKEHALVISKDTKSMEQASPEVIGHLMVVAAKVAKTLKMQEGYRIVMNNSKNGKTCYVPEGNLFCHVIGG